MSKTSQALFNFRCLLRDIRGGQWPKAAFHLAGLRRALT